MGDDGNTNKPAPAEDQTNSVYSNYKNHCSAQRVSTDLAVTEALRTAYPDCNVTGISKHYCDLVEFANAGHATLKLQPDTDKAHLERVYHAPRSRMEESPGKLDVEVKFGSYEITWQNQTWTFYIANWTEQYMGFVTWSFVLTPKHSATKPDDLLLAACKWTSDLHNEIYVFDNGDWEKNPTLWSAVQSASWDDVILDPSMKDTLIADVQGFFDSRTLYEEYAVPWKRGIILHGTPGCGKTISIKALMNSLDKRPQPVASLYVKSFKARCSTMQESIRYIFSRAREMAPCLLVFEDLDSLVEDEVRSYFLNEVDGLEDNNGILMIGSTNHLERLDPGISKRPSRFDRKYYYKIPGMRERVLYCGYWKKKLDRNSALDFDPQICTLVAELTDGFSFAYLKELFVQTLLTIVGGRQHELGDDEDDEPATTAGAAKVVPGSAKLAVGDEKVESNEGEEGIKTPERSVPTVDIPEHLKSNPLMQVLYKQAIALWKDMDSANDEEAGVKVSTAAEAPADGEAGRAYQMQLKLLRQQNLRRFKR